MIKIAFILISFGLYIIGYSTMTSDGAVQTTIKATGISLDTLSNKINVVYNDQGLPSYYFSDVFTPVCNTSECLPVRIELHWSLDGDFLEYKLIPNEILTKTDHVPFTSADYVLLDRILNDSLSVLSEHTVHSLEHVYVGKTDVDGVSGATSSMAAGTYIPGALYTSVRLWHLVHDIKPRIRQFTREQLLKENDVEDLIARNDISGSMLALQEILVKSDNPVDFLCTNISKFDQLMLEKTLVFIKNSNYDVDTIAPHFFIHYKEANAPLKVLIEELWQSSALENTFLISLVEESLKSSVYAGITARLLSKQAIWDEELYHSIIDYCEQERNMNRRNKMKKILRNKNEAYPKSVKKRLKSKNW